MAGVRRFGSRRTASSPATKSFVRKYRDVVILFPKQSPWAPLVSSLDEFTGDFLADRGQPERQDRREL